MPGPHAAACKSSRTGSVPHIDRRQAGKPRLIHRSGPAQTAKCRLGFDLPELDKKTLERSHYNNTVEPSSPKVLTPHSTTLKLGA